MAAMGRQAKKAIIAMSGGVDSSVGAAALVEAGYDVTGVFLCLGSDSDEGSSGCCSPQDAADARRVAQVLGIGLYVLNVAEAFAPIIEHFLAEYAAGRTPNPCVHCNTHIKFGRLLRYADSLGVRHVATGHYARIVQAGGLPAIARSLDRRKDQSYALFGIDRASLGRILLPIGEMGGKAEVRRVALRLGLDVHDKPDSQEVCFVPDDDYVAFLRRRAPGALQPGEIVDADGRVLGRHDGYAQFTIGQRRGLRVAAGVPLYVTHIDPVTARVTVGTKEQTMTRCLRAERANWHRPTEQGFRAVVQIRYSHAGAPARVRLTGTDSFDVDFDEDVSAVTPGQAAVVYDGDLLLGGGWIAPRNEGA